MLRWLFSWLFICVWLPTAWAQRVVDVQHYTLKLVPDFYTLSIAGEVEVRFIHKGGIGLVVFQLDTALRVRNVLEVGGKAIPYIREGRDIRIDLGGGVSIGSIGIVRIQYGGVPCVAANPPWANGFVWRQSAGGKPWLGVTCQKEGASLWWPCKDDLADEPDSGVSLYIDAPLGLMAVCNGRLRGVDISATGKSSVWHWEVANPINTYCVTLNIGDYVCVREKLPSEKGSIDATVWLLRQDSSKGFPYLLPRVRQMMETYQALFGPYPWIRDGYQLVQTDYWGMEHQSCVAYGNHFKPDAFGLDFILIHESAHEWWGNAITVVDNADLWVHEAFASYAEVLLCEQLLGKKAAESYLNLQKSKTQCKSIIQGPRGVNYNGWEDSDMYYRGSGLLHTLRLMTGDSTRFLGTLRTILEEHTRKPATSESVLQILASQLGQEKAAFLRYALGLRCVPSIEVYKSPQGAYFYRLPNYLGDPIQLTDNHLLDGTWRQSNVKPIIPKGWLLKAETLAKRPKGLRPR